MSSKTSYEAFCEQVGLNPNISWYRMLYQGISDYFPTMLRDVDYEKMRQGIHDALGIPRQPSGGSCTLYDMAQCFQWLQSKGKHPDKKTWKAFRSSWRE